MNRHVNSGFGRVQRGFTLVELSVVLAIMALLAVMATPNLMEEINEKRANITIQDSQSILDAARAFRMANGVWPGNATCTNAIAALSATAPPFLGGIGAQNKYNFAFTTRCNANTFSLVQRTVPDWDGVVANGLTATTITNSGTNELTSVIGIPGSEPALDAKLSRGNVGNPELNRMRTTLLLGGNQMAEAGNITFSQANPRLTALVGNLTLDSAGNQVIIAPGDTLEVDDIRIRSRGNRLVSELLPNYVHKGTYIVRHGWAVIKPACGAGGVAKGTLRPGTMRGGYVAPNAGTGQFGFSYRLLNAAGYWVVETNIVGDPAERNLHSSLVDVYCYYP